MEALIYVDINTTNMELKNIKLKFDYDKHPASHTDLVEYFRMYLSCNSDECNNSMKKIQITGSGEYVYDRSIKDTWFICDKKILVELDEIGLKNIAFMYYNPEYMNRPINKFKDPRTVIVFIKNKS